MRRNGHSYDFDYDANEIIKVLAHRVTLKRKSLRLKHRLYRSKLGDTVAAYLD